MKPATHWRGTTEPLKTAGLGPGSLITTEVNLSAVNFKRIQKLVYERSGINLGHNKNQLVVARLNRLLRSAQCDNYDDYLERVAGDTTGESLCRMIDALTTNHTAFFREPAHFALLRTFVAGEWANRPKIDVWSAASST